MDFKRTGASQSSAPALLLHFSCLVFIVVLFLAVVLSYTVQTELSQFIQTDKGYTKPYFLLYLTHTGYALIAPFHLVALKILGIKPRYVLPKVQAAFTDHFAQAIEDPDWFLQRYQVLSAYDHVVGFPLWPLLKLVGQLAFFVAAPALCWKAYSAVPLTSMTDITAIYNSNAFWAYILSIYIAKTERWQVQKSVAVLLACFGVVVIAYGDSGGDSTDEHIGIGSRLLGNLLALGGSIAFGFYEVFYQTHAALEAASVTKSNDTLERPSLSKRASRRFLIHKNMEYDSQKNSRAPSMYEINEDVEQIRAADVGGVNGDVDPEETPLDSAKLDLDEDLARPSYLNEDGTLDVQTFLAYSNIITASIGIATLFLLWIPIPLLHFTGIERFSLPPDLITVLAIFCNVLGGVAFNAGFMIMIALYGSVLAAVGALFTVVSVVLADFIIGKAALSLASIAGSALIVGGFTILAHDALYTKE